MSRKRLLLISLVSLVALAVWRFVPGKTTPKSTHSCAAAAAYDANPCELQVIVTFLAFCGTPAKPQSATAHWIITDLPYGYHIKATEVTFNFILANGKVISQTTAPAPGQASVDLAWPGPAGSLDPPDRPQLVSTTVKVTAVANDPQKIKSGVNSTNL